MRSAAATNLASRAPATSSTGIGQRREAVPQRLLGARAGEPQARRQAVHGVAAAVVEVGVGERRRTSAGRPSGRGTRRGRRARATRRGPRRRPGARPARRRRRCPPVALTGRAARRGRAGRWRGAGTGARPSSSRRTSPVRRPRRAARRRRRGRPGRPPSHRGPARRRRRPRGRAASAGDERVPRPAGLGEAVDEDEARPVAARGGREPLLSRHVRWPRGAAGPARTRPGPGRRGSTSGRR